MPKRRSLFAVLLAAAPLAVAHADAADVLDDYVGYTIAARKTIDGYRDRDGKKSDDFDWCDFDRKIVFDDGTTLTCSTFGYTYSYRPTAIILVKALTYQGSKFTSVVMVVGDKGVFHAAAT